MIAKTGAPYERVLAMSATTLKALPVEGEDGRYIEGFASTDAIDETKEIVLASAFEKGLPKFLQHPVITYNHDWDQPIGRVLDISIVEGGLRIEKAQLLDPGDPLADMAWRRIDQGVVKGLSIGFNGAGDEPGHHDEEKNVWVWTEIQLREIAVTPIPANYEATLQVAKGLGIDLSLLDYVKTVVPFQDLPTAPEDRAWDAGAARKRIRQWAGGDDTDWAKYRNAFVWYDADEADTVGGYKLAVADVVGGELKVVWRGVAAAMAVMHGARGGADIPATDHPAVVNHLAKYYAKFDKEPPEKAGAFTEGEKEIFEEARFSEDLTRLTGLAESTANIARHWEKESRVLSAANAETVEGVCDTLHEMLRLYATSRDQGVLPVVRVPERPRIVIPSSP